MIELNLNFLKEGGPIHIKKSHKGRFTEWCHGKVTRECIIRGKASSDPKVRKLATFAENARTWKHQWGGNIVFSSTLNKILDDVEDPSLSKEETAKKASSEKAVASEDADPNAWIENYMKDLITDAPQVTSDEKSNTTPKTKKYNNKFVTSGETYDKLDDKMKGLISVFEEEGIDLPITSGFRAPGAAGKAKNSWHPRGGAFDAALDESVISYDDFEQQILNNDSIMKYMADNNIGWIREDSPEMMKKTGATGKHIHFGYDKLANSTRTDAIAKKQNNSSVQYGLEGMEIQFESDLNRTPKYADLNLSKGLETTADKQDNTEESEDQNDNWMDELSNALTSDISKENSEDQTTSSTTTSVPELSNTEAAKQTISYLMQLGYTRNWANAITGVLNAESKLQPGIYNEAAKARNEKTADKGIAQWLGSRRADYDAYMNGKETNLQNELDFLNYEIQNKRSGLYDYIKSHPDASLDEAVDIIHRWYENGSANAPASKEQMIATYTKAWEKTYGDKKKYDFQTSHNTRLANAQAMANIQV